MCSFPIREARISRVVFAIKSPIMGGFSRWNVLRDAELSNTMPEAFAEPPEVVADDFEAVADHRVEGSRGMHQLAGELHRFGLHAAADAFLHRRDAGHGGEVVSGCGDHGVCSSPDTGEKQATR